MAGGVKAQPHPPLALESALTLVHDKRHRKLQGLLAANTDQRAWLEEVKDTQAETGDRLRALGAENNRMMRVGMTRAALLEKAP